MVQDKAIILPQTNGYEQASSTEIAMSLMIVKIVPEGLIFGADRNVTHSSTTIQQRGNQVFHKLEVGYGNRPKVLRWPNKRALVGYVGAASMGEIFTDEWLSDFIGRNHDFQTLAQVAKSLKEEAEAQRKTDDAGQEPQPQIFHLTGFEKSGDEWYPHVYYISNCWSFVEGQYADVRDHFGEFPNVFALKYEGKTHAEIMADLAARASRFEPRWFHQGINLEVFNELQTKLSEGCCQLVSDHKMPQPASLQDWENHTKFSLLSYGAYFQAFEGPLFQAVGGGADVFSLAWPT